MNPSPSTAPVAAAAVPSDNVLDASCRVPLFSLFVSAAVWLLIASGFGLIASIKFHGPNFLADCAWLTYGRVHPAATNALLYGFAMQAGLGVALWIIVRLSGSPIRNPWLLVAGAKLWNLGVFIGLLGIFFGDSTGFENLEMPRYAAVLLFLGYTVIGVCAILKLHDRRETALGPVQWFLLAALFWFPWIFSTAHLLLTFGRVRGVTQAIIAWWYSNNLNFIWLGLIGLGVIFYFVPRIAGRALHSRHLASFAFWTLILFGTWCGIPSSAPVPAWMPALSGVAAVLTVVTLIAIGLNIHGTKKETVPADRTDVVPRFIYFGLGMFQLAGLMRVLTGFPEISHVTNFTWFTVAQWQLNAFGFFAMTVFGAIYYIVPRVTGLDWPCAKSVRAHFWLAAAGILLLALPLAIGGVLQGLKLNSTTDFMVLTKSTAHFLRVSTIGELLILAGNFLLAINLIALSVRYYRTHFIPAYAAATAEIKTAEVRS